MILANSNQVVASTIDSDLRYPGEGIRQGITVFLFGAPGTWKTTWAGTWPKPLFFSVGQEGGDDALAMLPDLFGIPAPPTYHISNINQMMEKVERVSKDYKRMGINTVVIDSITYYADMWVSEVMEKRCANSTQRRKLEEAGALQMTMRDWGLLAMHIRDLAMKLHNTELNVIWTALEKEIKETDERLGASRVIAVEPYVKGEMALKLPGMCKMIIHANKDMKPDANVIGRMQSRPIYYTSPNSLSKIIRHKYGNAFAEGKLVDPDPQYGDFPSFRAIQSRVGKFVYVT